MWDFFHFPPYAFGLDISDLSLKIASLQKDKRAFRLTAFGEFPIPEGVIQKGEIKKQDELVQILRNALSHTKGGKISTKYAVASLPEEQAFLQVIQLPPMKEEEVSLAIRFEAENYIPYPLDTVYLDSQIISPVHDHLSHVDVLLTSLPKTIVDSYVQVFKKAGLIPKVLEIESLAVSRALVKQEVAPTPLLIADIGSTRTGLSIFSGYGLRFTTSIPLSSEELTNAIAKTLRVERKKAEEFKKRYGLGSRNSSSSGKEVFEALIPPLTDLMEQIKKYLTYYESHASHQHLSKNIKGVTKIILCGGGANLPGLVEFLTKGLHMEVAKGNPWINILPSPLKEIPPLSMEDSLRYTTALGLALRGIRDER
ncbi:MAG: type IV pilus assembly protein PilM [Patescibacteria group bacterium]